MLIWACSTRRVRARFSIRLNLASVFSVPCSISIPIPIPLTEITCHFHSVPVLSQYFYSRSNSVPAGIFVPFPFRFYFELLLCAVQDTLDSAASACCAI